MGTKKKSVDTAALLQQLKHVQTRALLAMFSDDTLLDRLVLKGGSALDLIHGVSDRSSIDLDFSMEGDFSAEEQTGFRDRFARLLQESFRSDDLAVFDVRFLPKPSEISEDVAGFWGGYWLGFKLIPEAKKAELSSDLEAMRRNAMRVGASQNSVFEIEISRFEYCADKQQKVIEGYTVFAYSPRLIVCEKIRAICQQMPEYRAVIHSHHARPRARDFFDIYNLVRTFTLETRTRDFWAVLEQVFKIKHVPCDLLWKISEARDYHFQDFDSVRNTVTTGTHLLEFDEYFNYVVALVTELKPFWNK